MKLPIGTSPAKAAFFHEVAAAMTFLSLWHSLTVAEQEELQAVLLRYEATVAERTKSRG